MNNHIVSALRVPLAALAFTGVAPNVSLATTLPNAVTAIESFDSGTLHVDRYGAGNRAVIFIPGLGCGTFVWNATIARLAPANAVYAVTLPGFDGRPSVKNEASLFAAFDRDLLALIDRRKLDHPAIVGHSLGGTLAIAFAESHPDVPRAIVAVDGLPVFPTLAFSTPDARTAFADTATRKIGAMSHADLLAYDTTFMASIGTVDPTLVAPTAELEAKSDPAAVAAWAHEDFATDLRPKLSQIAAPMLEIMPYDAADRTAPPANYTQEQTLAFYRGLLTGVPNVSVVPISDARHFVMLDRPDAFATVLDGFLAAHP